MNTKELEQLTNAAAKFSEVVKSVDMLQTAFTTLEKKLRQLEKSIVSNEQQFSKNEPVLWSEEKAKHFLTFMKNVKTNNLTGVDFRGKALNESVDGEGGFLVPEEFVASITYLVEQYGVARKMCRNIPMKTDVKNLPALLTGPQAFWVEEGIAIPESSLAFSQVKLQAKKLAAILPATVELEEDSAIPVAALIAELIAEALAAKEDHAVFYGNPNDLINPCPITGICFDTNTTFVQMPAGKTAFTDVTADDLLTLSASVKASVQGNSAYYVNRTVFDIVRKLKGNDGHYIYQAPANATKANANNILGTLWGYDIYSIEALPSVAASAAETPFVIFGDLKYYMFGDRRKITAAVSAHVKFLEDMLVYKFTERFAGAVAIADSFAVLKTADV